MILNQECLQPIYSVDELPEFARTDREYGPALWLLTSPLIAEKIPAEWVVPERRHVAWEQLLERSRGWSHGERILIAVAFNLWSSNSDKHWMWGAEDGGYHLPDLNPYQWACVLGRAHYMRVLVALALAAGLEVRFDG